jgi:hypothetical protein
MIFRGKKISPENRIPRNFNAKFLNQFSGNRFSAGKKLRKIVSKGKITSFYCGLAKLRQPNVEYKL